VPMTEEEDHDIQLQRAPGGLESLPDKDRIRVSSVHDVQLERAMDLLKGVNLFTQRSPLPEKRVAKGDKVAVVK
jgi:hypothetical protein